MKNLSHKSPKSFFRKLKIPVIVIFCVFASIYLLILLGALKGTLDNKRTAIPDLSKCTRFEIKFSYSIFLVLSRYIPKARYSPEFNTQNILNQDEQKYLNSLDIITVTDPECIKQLQGDLKSIENYSYKKGILEIYDRNIVCYNNNDILASLYFNGNLMATDVGNQYYSSSPNGFAFLPDYIPELKPFSKRTMCAIHLLELRLCFKDYYKSENNYPTANNWCDDLINSSTMTVSIRQANTYIKCPSAGEGKCHYAMNPNCEPNSPKDMVLLFETKAGWNQHGGPELFTFDNHDPKGGCVLFNDGTVKFIRTEEELNALRWK
jgi:hypothetical protein